MTLLKPQECRISIEGFILYLRDKMVFAAGSCLYPICYVSFFFSLELNMGLNSRNFHWNNYLDILILYIFTNVR